jgi:hypothetical protein
MSNQSYRRKDEITDRRSRHVDAHRTPAQIHQVCYEGGDGVGRRHAIRSKTVRIYLVARVQRAGDRPGRFKISQRTLGNDGVRLTVCSQLLCSPRFHGRSLSSLAINLSERQQRDTQWCLQKRTFARRERERAMAEATPRSARQGMVLSHVLQLSAMDSNTMVKTDLVQRDPHEYTRT